VPLLPAHRTATYRVWWYQMLYNTIWPPEDEHNSDRNMYRNIINIKQEFCALSWSVAKIIRRCTVNKTSKAWLCSLQCRWRQQVSLKRPCIYTGLHGEKLRNDIRSHHCGNLSSYRVCLGLRLDAVSIVPCARKCSLSQALSQICEKWLFASWNNSAPTGRIFMKYDIWVFLKKNYRENLSVIKCDKNYGYVTCRPVYIVDRISLRYY